MKDTMDTREYVAQAIEQAGSTLKSVSLAMGRSHAYLQQYVKGRSPATLEEQDREFLVQHFGLDNARLKPAAKNQVPPALLAEKGASFARGLAALGNVNAKQSGNLKELTSEALLMKVWAKLSPGMQNAVLVMLHAHAAEIGNLDDVG